MTKITFACALALTVLAPGRARPHAQTLTGEPRFEVASIKANTSGDLGSRLQPSPGRLTVTNMSLRGLVRFAYELQDFQIDGGPAWFAADRFDVAARADGDQPVAEIRLMLRALLAERFKLAVHRESRELPIYALVMARGDGRLGPELRRTPVECASQPATNPVPPDPNAPCWPSNFLGPAPGTPIMAARLGFRGMTMDAFVRTLAPIVRRAVVNRTGLVGSYDAEFDASAELPPPPPPPGSGIANPFDPQNMASIFTILQEQLGLKLESTRGLVDVVIVDRAEKPVDN